MAVAGLQVLLIDCDLRRSRCAALAGAKAGRAGLISILEGRCALDDAVIADARSPLKLLVPEKVVASPQDLLGHALDLVIREAKDHYDVVILDTPPVAAVGDAFLVTQLADAVVLTVRWRATSATTVANAISAYRDRGLRITGLCLNQVNLKQFALSKGEADVYKVVKSYYPAA
jgi:Mrp family chromosome partitioning ATPase